MILYKLLFLTAALVFVFGQTATAQDERQILNPADIPVEGRQTKDFPPKSWKVREEIKGDLNGDKLADSVLILSSDAESNALIIVFKNSGGSFSRAAVAPDALYCDCSSTLGDGTPQVKIERGQILFDGLSGSRESQNKKMRFRWDAAAKRFLLIGDDLQMTDRLRGETQIISSNYLTNTRIVTEIAPKRASKKSRQKIKPQRIFLDDLDYRNYWEKFETTK